MSTPKVGNIVHYTSYGTPKGEFTSQCRAAVVTEVDSDAIVGLAILNPTGAFFNVGVPHSEKKSGGTWHWPEEE